MNCFVSQKSYANDIEISIEDEDLYPEKEDPQIKPRFSLILPEFDKLVLSNGEVHIATTVEGFATVLNIYNAYVYLGENYDLMFFNNILLKRDIRSYELELNQCKETLDTTKKDREFAYKLREEDKKLVKKEEFKAKLQTILITTGVGVVGVAAGIIIGFFAIR